jgi:hypothetical protein
MKQILAKIRPVGKKTYTVIIEGIDRDGQEQARYQAEFADITPELCARKCAGAYTKGYNDAVHHVTLQIEEQLKQARSGGA